MTTLDYQRAREACNDSLLYSRFRREEAVRRSQRRRRLRILLSVPLMAGLIIAGYCAVNGDATGRLTLIAVALMVPFVASFDLLGER